MRDECGAGICSSFGMTEAAILTTCGPRASDEHRATTEGHASPGVTIEVVGPDGVALDPGVVGEVVVRGPQVCHGYLDPALDDAFDSLGRLHTGDLGRLDHEGYLTITGRLKDVIIRKGENISAKEIEDLIYEHPAVGDVAVIGLPHPHSGEMACAVVAPAPGAEPLQFDEMVAFLRGRQVMTQKIPERLEIVDSLPRNAAGKVMKQVLQARYG
jgi:acyl-CoA synthetase (AMP-forming)/AMP-acid ligase II